MKTKWIPCELITIKKNIENGKRERFRKTRRESDKKQMTWERFSNAEQIETREREL
jgi:hypothetical protein